MNMNTILTVLQGQAENRPEAAAILGLEGQRCTYQILLQQAQAMRAVLTAQGISPSDPVAIVLPNGPLMAGAFLSIASLAASAPLNPAYSAHEFEFFLRDLGAKAVVVETESSSPVSEVARQLQIPLIHLEKTTEPTAGLFSNQGSDPPGITPALAEAKPSDIALILHTSGTTSRPKMVPLTQKNLCTSARHISQTLKLTAQDRCLNIMPLFHIHGLMAAVLATLTAGGSLVCTPGFIAPRFFEWLDRVQPTWYTAVPTMHQAILNRAGANREAINHSSLRFVRSSSASLAPKVMKEIEDTFGVPVIEAYGMTEAAHQMASNPLPPGARKPGSVGPPAGPEIAIMQEDRPAFLPPGARGEIVIRGENVTLGYLNNPEANANVFARGWFRTGDQGYLDEDGYVFITGRIKEIINRGGEKISPREVDEVLLGHPGVIQAITFGYPDPVLGEGVAAAVIRADEAVTAQDLKRFAAQQLAQFKVPEKIIFLEEIPKGPTGKLQRIGLAEKVGLLGDVPLQAVERTQYTPPGTEIERKICAIWEAVLAVEQVGIRDPFSSIGGDSMLAALIYTELEAVFGVSVPLVDLYAAQTVQEQALIVARILASPGERASTNDQR